MGGSEGGRHGEIASEIRAEGGTRGSTRRDLLLCHLDTFMRTVERWDDMAGCIHRHALVLVEVEGGYLLPPARALRIRLDIR